MTLEERVQAYQKAFKNFPPIQIFNGRMHGLWFLGNAYGNKSELFGSFPGNFLKRMNTLFPEGKGKETLHLFSGSLPKSKDYVRLDLIDRDTNPEYLGDAQELQEIFPENTFQIIYADPPYSIQDAENYKTTMISRKKVIEGCHHSLKKGGYLIWLDQVFPMYRKSEWDLVATFGIVISTNHRVRCSFVLRF